MLAEKLDESLEILAGLWSGEPFDFHGEHFTVEGAQFIPTPTQQPRIPVWAACIVPHRAPLKRAARWDGVVLGNISETGAIEPVPVDEVRASVSTIAAQRAPDAGPFDVAVGHPGLPDPDELDAYADAGVTWVMATGWPDEMDRLAEMAVRDVR